MISSMDEQEIDPQGVSPEPEPAAPVEFPWSLEDVRAGWAAFEAAQALWRIEKNFDPRAVGKAEG